MNVMTPRCVVCNNQAVLEGVDALGYIRWSLLGGYIRDAMPEVADQRELLMTGTHAHCREVMWGSDDD